MALVRTPTLILQSFAYSDSSKILRLYTRDYGLRSVIAKGALRAKSRFGGLLEPFTEGEAHFYIKEGRDLHTLSGFDLLRSRQAIGRDLTAFAGASLVAELLLRFGTEEAHPELYSAGCTSLERLASEDPERVAASVLSAVWEMVALLGFRPELEHCVGCGREIEPQETTRFDVEAGGSACTRCRPTGRVVDPTTRAEVARMSAGEILRNNPADQPLHRALLRAFLAAHLTTSSPLRSLDLFAEQLR